ncbi:MAG: SLC13 family permease [Promethearchaeota archaeon]
MTEERDHKLGKRLKKIAYPRLLDYQWLKSQRIFDILLGTLGILLIGLFLFLYPEDPRVGNMILFGVIFIGSFLLIAKYHHRQLTIILVASSISLILAYLLLEEFQTHGWSRIIYDYMEWEVLAVVFGMSILVEATSETGLFDWVIIRMLKISKGNIFPLFALTFLLTFSLSTVLANVTAMILVSSMILTVCNGLDYDPTPFLLSAVMATSLAGMATLVSSLPTIMVGSSSAGNIGFIDFILISVPFLIITIPITILYLKRVFPAVDIPLGNVSKNGIDKEMILSLDEWGVVEDRRKFYLAALSLALTVVGFILSQPLDIYLDIYLPIGVIAILGGILAVILTRSDEHQLIRGLSWDALLFFAGLFILVGTLEDTHVLEDIAKWLLEISGGDLFFAGILILIIASLVSGILDNIPVTAALIPVVADINELPAAANNPRFLWFILIFAGAFGGGLTPFGSAASILAISILMKEGQPLDFKYFMVRLVPISLILLVFSGIYLSIFAFVLGVI